MKTLLDYRGLVWALVVRDLKVRYRRSAIGFLWTMLQPLLTLLVYHLVFSSLFRFDVRNYPVYALAGILFWSFFSGSIVASMNSLKSNAQILSKLPVPMAVFPIANVASGVINLLFALVPLFAILVVTDSRIGPALLFLPVAILIATAFTLGAGLLLSPLAVFFADVVELIGVVLSLWYFLTPCFYPMEIAEGHRFYWVIRYNPIRSVLEVFRDPIYHAKIPPWTHLSLATIIAVACLAIGILAFRRTSHRIPFHL